MAVKGGGGRRQAERLGPVDLLITRSLSTARSPAPFKGALRCRTVRLSRHAPPITPVMPDFAGIVTMSGRKACQNGRDSILRVPKRSYNSCSGRLCGMSETERKRAKY